MKRRIKVLYVIDGLGTGGAERSLAELLPLLRRTGIEPTVACLHRREEGVQDQVLAQGFDVRLMREANFVSRVRALRELIIELRPDLIHTAIFESNLAGRFAAWGRHVPTLTTLANTSYDPIRLRDPRVRRSRLTVTRAIDSWTARHLTTHFHAITKAVEAAAIRDLRIPPERISVIERGRDPSRLGQPSPQRREQARRRLGLSERDEVLLNVGRQEYQKGQQFLLEAFRLLASERHRLMLLVAGRNGNATHSLQATRARLGLDGSVRFLGHREDVPDLLAAADLFVFPSLYEGLGGAVIEAMALGLPIVATDIPAMREVLEEGGNALLVAPEAPSALASAVRQLLTQPARAGSFGLRSRQLFEERYTLQRSAERIINLYYSVVNRE